MFRKFPSLYNLLSFLLVITSFMNLLSLHKFHDTALIYYIKTQMLLLCICYHYTSSMYLSVFYTKFHVFCWNLYTNSMNLLNHYGQVLWHLLSLYKLTGICFYCTRSMNLHVITQVPWICCHYTSFTNLLLLHKFYEFVVITQVPWICCHYTSFTNLLLLHKFYKFVVITQVSWICCHYTNKLHIQTVFYFLLLCWLHCLICPIIFDPNIMSWLYWVS